jgi:threonine/homoserine/homoserine lactone efflux protein
VSGQLVAFVGVSLVVNATPGTDSALTIRNTLLGGRRCGVLTAAGVACGQATWAICTAAGLSQLLRASQPAFFALRLVGVRISCTSASAR